MFTWTVGSNTAAGAMHAVCLCFNNRGTLCSTHSSLCNKPTQAQIWAQSKKSFMKARFQPSITVHVDAWRWLLTLNKKSQASSFQLHAALHFCICDTFSRSGQKNRLHFDPCSKTHSTSSAKTQTNCNLSHFYPDRANASSLGVVNRNKGRPAGSNFSIFTDAKVTVCLESRILEIMFSAVQQTCWETGPHEATALWPPIVSLF